MSRKDRRARDDHARDLVSAITAPAPAAKAAPGPTPDPATRELEKLFDTRATPLPSKIFREGNPSHAPMLGHFVRHSYRNGELVNELRASEK